MTSLPRTIVIVGLVGVIVACLASLWAADDRTRQRGTERLSARALDDLALLAGLRDDEGERLRDEPMPVEVIQDGGPLWVRDAVIEAVEDDPYFEVGNSRHLLRAEVVEARSGLALQLHLWRSGWDLRVPEPRQLHIAPWAPVVGLVLGAVAGIFLRRVSVMLVVAGLTAQLLLGLDPVPAELVPAKPLTELWAEGPLIAPVLDWIDSMTTIHLAVAGALVAMCLVLVAFDHRRSREREDSLDLASASLAAVLGSLGAVGWLEAASRGSLFAAFTHPAGWVVLLGLVMTCVPMAHVAREEWRAKAS